MDERYQKFTASKQEPLRLSIALEEFFRDETASEARDAYGQYLRRRLQLNLADSFGSGPEMLLFVSALTRTDRAMDFICLHGCAPYLEYSQNLLYREREQALRSACAEVLSDFGLRPNPPGLCPGPTAL